MRLLAVMQALYASEINCGLQTFYDGGLEVWIGDEMNGRRSSATFDINWDAAAAEWLSAEAMRLYPRSLFALVRTG